MSIPGMEELADRPRPVCRVCGRVMGARICTDCNRKMKGKPPLTTKQRKRREDIYVYIWLCIFALPVIFLIIEVIIA